MPEPPNNRKPRGSGAKPALNASASPEVVRAFEGILGSLDQRLCEVDSTLEEHDADLKAIERTLRGDQTSAEPTGLLNKIAALSMENAQIKQSQKDLADKFDKLIWWIIGLLLTVALGAVGIITSRFLVK